MKPLVAIVGRPNVGKSTLFNRLSDTKKAIVIDEPGATRDRNYGESDWNGKQFRLVDTGGFEPLSKERMLEQMRQQTTLALEEAHLQGSRGEQQSFVEQAKSEHTYWYLHMRLQ